MSQNNELDPQLVENINKGPKIFTLEEVLSIIDNSYAIGKAICPLDEKEKMLRHIKESILNWHDIVIDHIKK